MLEHFLITQIFCFLLVFCRIGSGIMVFPGFGETYVPVTIRLGFALAICLVMVPVLSNVIPPLPSSGIMLMLLVFNEILIGIFIGSLCKILVGVTHVAGTIFSLQAGVSSAVVFDANQNSQGSIVGNLFGLVTIVLIFCTDLHYLMLRGITESYSVFVPGKYPPLADFVGSIAHTVSDSFSLAIQISAPSIIIGTLLFLGAGIISRLMPNVQVFFIIIAPQLMIGFFVLIATFSAMMLFYMEFYKDHLLSIMGYLK